MRINFSNSPSELQPHATQKDGKDGKVQKDPGDNGQDKVNCQGQDVDGVKVEDEGKEQGAPKSKPDLVHKIPNVEDKVANAVGRANDS